MTPRTAAALILAPIMLSTAWLSYRAVRVGSTSTLDQSYACVGIGQQPKQFVSRHASWFRGKWHRSAELGSPEGRYLVAMCQLFEADADAERQSAQELMQRLADEGFPPAQVTFAQLAAQGDVISWERVAAYLVPPAEQGIPSAAFDLARLYQTGAGVPRDERSALSWMVVAASQGNTSAQVELMDRVARGEAELADFMEEWATSDRHQETPAAATLRLVGELQDLEPEDASSLALRDRLREIANRGYAPAAFRLALAYTDLAARSGDASARRQAEAEAHSWMDRAAQGRVLNALLERAGQLDPSTPDRARQLRCTAAAQLLERSQFGDAWAAETLAYVTLDHSSIPEELDIGLACLEQSATAGSPRAQSYLGALLLTDQLGDPQPALAARYLRMAAEQQDADAQYQLAHLYRQGIGVQPSAIAAAEWLTAAAEQGHVDASRDLAQALRSGAGVVPDARAAEELERYVAGQMR